jgi:nitrogen fixation protein NifU and related proteins
MYSPQLLDHFQNPRNAGDLDAPDVFAQVENPACGDVLRLSANVRDGRISEIRFKAKGCVPSIACGSAMTELARGKTIAEAKALRREELVQAVGGLPEASNHAAQLALEVLGLLIKKTGAAG